MPHPRGGDWLEEEIIALKQAGVEVLVSLLTPQEEAYFRLQEEESYAVQHGMKFISFPIIDMTVPDSQNATLDLVDKINSALKDDKGVAIHCRAGIGRSGMITAAVLLGQGKKVEFSFETVSQARGIPVPETLQQAQWVARLYNRPLPD